ncbi:hypothetical protein D8674_021862 [Pyrus ussuriensis x Pyrus communis]|uniref:C2H2-type domain-containing protein n=1 Tax=Pyrus ussuriensis x Pyrus communis TaxID=2448454 RepID=A0A5N5GWW0_9ROSA|nr:hypothetical protein D8674_021862 [Pyrus ussuriensis x Pyrus communis]
MEIPDDFCSHVSAPATPGRYCSSANNNNVFFFSVPTSPRRRTISSTYDDYPTPPMTPYHDANSKLGDFEFDTSNSFNLGSVDNVTSQQVKDLFERKEHEQRQTMAFADDLFCEGKVMPLAPPLKLPPRLGQKRYTNQSPTPSTPRSPSSGIKMRVLHRRLWNDDFDPFMVALQHVREEEKRGVAETEARDISDLNDQQNKQTGLQTPIHSPSVNSPSLLQSPTRLALPRGLEFARQVRLIGMELDHSERRSRPKLEMEMPKNTIAQESGGPCKKQTKGQKIRRLLLSALFGKPDDEDKKRKDQTSEILKKPTFLRRLSFKSGRSTSCKAKKRISNQLTKTTLVQFRPRLLLCMVNLYGQWGGLELDTISNGPKPHSKALPEVNFVVKSPEVDSALLIYHRSWQRIPDVKFRRNYLIAVTFCPSLFMEKPVYASIPFGLHFQCTSSDTPPENPSENCRERNHTVHFATTVTTSRSSGSNDRPPSEKQPMQGMSQLTLSQFVAASRRTQVNADRSRTIHLQKNENSLLWFMQPSFSLASEVSQYCSYDPSSHNQLRDPINLNTIEFRGNKEFARTPASVSYPDSNFSFFTWNEPHLYMERSNLSELRSYKGSNPSVNLLAPQQDKKVGSNPSLPDGIGTKRNLNKSKYAHYICPKCPCEFVFSENLDAHMSEHQRIEDQTNRMRSLDSASRLIGSECPLVHSQFIWNLENLAGHKLEASYPNSETSSAEIKGSPSTKLDIKAEAISSIIKSIK